MKIAAQYSHLNGFEWLMYHRPGLWDELTSVIESLEVEACRTKESLEKTMKGKMLYSPPAINACFKASLNLLGWDESRTGYWVTDDFDLIRRTLTLGPDEQKAEIVAAGKNPIYSYNQTDFVKDRVAIEVQFGKYSFVAYDLFVKHLAFYIGNQIDLGIEVLPMKSLQAELSSGPGYYEGALYDIARQGRTTPPVPLVLLGIA